MANGRVPSVSEIRIALEDIPGALREAPLPEDVREESDRATPIWYPGDGDQDALDMPDSLDESDGLVDEPNVIFEVPPGITEAEIRNILGDDMGDLKRLEQVRGIDALGWYVTFHQRRYQHGIYLPIRGLLRLAIGALTGLPISVERKIEIAFHAILRHELFHFAADCMAANWELASGNDVYWKAKTALRNAAGYIELEEALANAYMLRGFRWPTRALANSGGAYPALGRYCQQQPTGYDLGPKYARNPGNYVAGCQELSASYQHSSLTGPGWRVPWELDASRLYPDITRIAWGRCPIFILDELDLLRQLGIQLDLFRAVVGLDETASFRKELRRLEKPVQKKWDKCKQLLAQSTSVGGLDFKRWEPGGDDCYSVRVDLKHRAHLRYARGEQTWSAIGIGGHDYMGH